MSGWAKNEPSAGSGRGPSILNKIPGYSGYRAKEARRDEDKQVRLELARGYDQIAQRLADLQGELVRASRFAEIGNVERLERSLRLFNDRLRTATYGYGGLFSERSIDERALDQIAAFDRALGDGTESLRASIEAVAGAIDSGDDLPGKIRAARAQIDTLNRRFELRGQAVESGQPLPEAAVADLFITPQEEEAHVADDLHFGDAISIGGTDYVVKGRMEFHSGGSAWRQFLLRDNEVEQWLHVPPSTAEPMALLSVAAETPAEGEQITVGDTKFTAVMSGNATSEMIGEAGKQTGRQTRFRRYEGGDGMMLFVYDWGGEKQALVGRALDPLEVKVYAI